MNRYCFLILALTFFCNGLSAQQFLDMTLAHEGEQREYSIYIPAAYDGNKAYPLMFNFHGGAGDIASQVGTSDMRPLADTDEFLLVYPQALGDPNDGGSANWLHKDPTDFDDVTFVNAMIDEVSTQYEVDESRIYACGYSLGGEFTYELACRLNDRIAAVGAVARTMSNATFDECAPSHPTAIMTILGTEDFISPYDGLVWEGIQYYLSADEMHDYWINQNNTSSDPTIIQLPNLDPSDGSTVERITWGDGDGCVSVEHLKVNGGDHDWPGTFGNMDIDATQEIWDFVSQYDTTGLITCGGEMTSVLETNRAEPKIKIYPNPLNDILHLDLKNNSELPYTVYSIGGHILQQGIIDANNKAIYLRELNSGMYLLQINNQLQKIFKN